MKNNIFILFFLISHIILAQDSYKAKKISDYNQVLNEKTNDIYELDIEQLKNLIESSPKKYHLIYTFGYWCKPCIETLPEVLKLTNENKNIQLYLLNIEKKDKAMMITRNFLRKKFNYLPNSFTVSSKYGNTRWGKYKDFVEELVPGHDEYGMSLFILLDKDYSVLYASNYNQEKEFRLNRIRGIITKN